MTTGSEAKPPETIQVGILTKGRPMLATVMVIVQMLYVDERSDAPPRSDDADGNHDPDLDEPLSASAPAAG